MMDSVHDAVSLADFVGSVVFASKDASWDTWLVECLQANDLKVCCVPMCFPVDILLLPGSRGSRRHKVGGFAFDRRDPRKA